MGGSMSDLFYPDNPKRRARAQQLYTDAKYYISAYDSMKAHADDKSVGVREKMNAYLNKHGYSSFADLDAAVRSKLVGDDLEKWHQLNQSVHDNNLAVEVIGTIGGVGLVAGAATIGGLVALGLMTGPVGWAALGTVGTIAGIGFILDAILGAILGAEERAELRDAIDSLSVSRLQIFHAFRNIQTYDGWIANFDTFLNAVIVDDPDQNAELVEKIFEDRFGQYLKEDVDNVSLQHCWDALHQIDRDRSAWMDEDPSESWVVQSVSMQDQSKYMLTVASPTQRRSMPELKPVRTFEVTAEGEETVTMQMQWLKEGVDHTMGYVQDLKTTIVWSVHTVVSPVRQLKGTAAKLSDFQVYLQDTGNPENKMNKCRVKML